jgi:uncharacterized protein (DUF1919 family)
MAIFEKMIRSNKKALKRFIFRSRLKNPDFCIVANNCWGSRIYQELDFRYNTPFVGLFIYSPCFIRLLSDLIKFLSQRIIFIDQSKYPTVKEQLRTRKYPIGLLGGEVEIHFLHYKSSEEAEEKWQSRSERMNFNNLFIAFNDRDLFEPELLMKFEEMPFKNKVFFTSNQESKTPSSVWISEFASEPCVGDLYNKSYLVHRHFDVIDWLNKGTGNLKPWIRFLNKMIEIS